MFIESKKAGLSGRMKNMDNSYSIVFDREEHLFFDELVHLIFCISALGMIINDNILFTKPEENFFLEGMENASNQVIRFYPYEVIMILKGKGVPKYIYADIYPLVPDLETQLFKEPKKGPDTKLFQQAALMPLFVNFYEKGLPHIEKIYGKALKLWPADSAWNFGRIIRNSFVHADCRIVLDRGKSVKWRNIEYDNISTKDKPRFLFADLGVADVIFLMIDMNNEIKASPLN